MGVHDFQGKTVFVTGAAQDQGRAVAWAFARAGAKLSLFDTRAHAVELELLAWSLRAEHCHVQYFLGDVRNEANVSWAVEKTVKSSGGIDVLFNSTGISTPGQCWEITEEAWDMVLDVNLKGAWIVAKWVAPEMVLRKSGLILNYPTEPETCEGGSSVHYAASRWGVAGLTKALASELAPFGVRAISLHSEGELRSPRDVAEAALFLAGPFGQAWEGTDFEIEPGFLARESF